MSIHRRSVLSATALAVAAFATTGSAWAQAEDIVLGGSIPMTGVFAFAGIGVNAGMQDYFKIVNDAGGVKGRKIKYVFEDTAYKPDVSVAAFKKITGGNKVQGPRLLVLCPTRELALQVQKQAGIYGAGIKKLRTVCLVGGAPFGPQFQAMRYNPEVMIATPGRLIDHMERSRIDFSRLEVLVLDEADRMLDMGFVEDIEHIVSRTPSSRQTLLFSATLDGMVGKIAAQMTQSPKRIEVVTKEEHKANIDQRLFFTDDVGHKHRLLDVLLRDVDLTQALVFTATKSSAEALSETLLENGFAAAALHGDMPQHKRNRTLQRLRDGQTRILVATDVAARGIDVAGISHVINFDAPRQAEDYVHRIEIGRASCRERV